jgi:O-antigen/teichoic acid export membrane protein
MSTVSQIIPPIITCAAVPRKGRLFGRNIWAAADQILISGGNFLVTVLIARALTPAEFGTFTLVYSALLLANIFQSTLITQAHNVLAADRAGRLYRRYTANTALGQLLLVGVEAGLALVVTGFAALKGWPATPLLIWVAPLIVAWQLQEFGRRVLYTEGRFAAAFWNDCISYGGQVVVVAAFWYRGGLNGTTAMFAMVSTSAAAAALGAWQIRNSLELDLDLSALIENWAFGKWLVGGELLQWFASLQLYIYLTAYLIGTHAAGELRAAQTIFGPTRVFAFYLGSVLPIRFARALAQDGPRAVDELLMRTSLRVLPLLGLYCVAVAAFPALVLKLMFGSKYAGTPAVLSLYAFYAFMSYVQALLASALTARRLTRQIFLGNVYGALITLAMSYWIISYFKVAGAPMAIGISATIINVFFWRAYGSSRRDPASYPAERTPGAFQQ